MKFVMLTLITKGVVHVGSFFLVYIARLYIIKIELLVYYKFCLIVSKQIHLFHFLIKEPIKEKQYTIVSITTLVLFYYSSRPKN